MDLRVGDPHVDHRILGFPIRRTSNLSVIKMFWLIGSKVEGML